MARSRPVYTPLPMPYKAEDQRSWTEKELEAISRAFEEDKETVVLTGLESEPNKIVLGMIVYATGAWDPGGGEGFYGRTSSGWVKLG